MGTKITDGFDQGDDEKVVSILSKWKGGVLSDHLFAAISKMTPQFGAIVVVFRKNNDKVEVLLLKRPDDDPVWPGVLNLPGKMIRSSDFDREDGNPINGPLERIQKDEIKSDFVNPPKFVNYVFQNTKRGPIMPLVFTADLPPGSSSNEWTWVGVDNFKDSPNIIDTELVAIEAALKKIYNREL